MKPKQKHLIASVLAFLNLTVCLYGGSYLISQIEQTWLCIPTVIMMAFFCTGFSIWTISSIFDFLEE
jgi:hypothetical protein